jgi:hypothetical protein
VNKEKGREAQVKERREGKKGEFLSNYFQLYMITAIILYLVLSYKKLVNLFLHPIVHTVRTDEVQ